MKLWSLLVVVCVVLSRVSAWTLKSMAVTQRQHLIHTIRRRGGALPSVLCHRRHSFAQLLKQPLRMSSTDDLPVENSSKTETYGFESNVARVMDIIIHSLYSNKDVFLRELISNAADACDKRRFLALQQAEEPEELKIRIYADRDANTLTIEDSGVGMNKQDLIQNLGRIAESGTKKFLDTAKQAQQSAEGALSLIGQFGVGFYSGFLVAKTVTVISKGSEGETWKWQAHSNDLASYSLTPETDNSLLPGKSGTRIVLSLKDESDQYLDDVALKALIERYSEFISFPIELRRMVTRPAAETADAQATMESKTVMKKVSEWTQVNVKKPLWLRSHKEVQKEEYDEFYRQTFRAHDTPMAHSHFSVEGNVDFKALLYLPTEIPYELTRDMFSPVARAMRLYVKRVFINDNFEDLIPRWLLFLRGVVDSDDMPLNVSREILQQSRSLRIIKQRLVKKAIDMFVSLSKNDPKGYQSFWRNFGKYIKVGVLEDDRHREDLLPLLRFFSTQANTEPTSLEDYLSRMPTDQPSIFYVVGESRAQAAASPALESLRKKGFEVLLLSEPIDEMTLQNIDKFQGKSIVDAGKELSKDLSDEEKAEKQGKNEDSEAFRGWLKRTLGDKITRVEASTRLVDSPAMIVQSEYGVSPNMQKYLRAQAVAENEDKEQFANIFNQAVLEINLTHPIVSALRRMFEETPDSVDARERCELLFSTAALAGGYSLDNAAEYAQLVVNLMTKSAE